MSSIGDQVNFFWAQMVKAYRSSRSDRLSGFSWIAFYLMVIASWIALFTISLPPLQWSDFLAYGLDLWTEICRIDPGSAGVPAVFAMWSIMVGAMMMPTFVPALKTYENLLSAGAGSQIGFFLLLAGYGIVWLLFSVAATAVQFVMHSRLSTFSGGIISEQHATAALLLLAGLYQFTPLKKNCLTHCQHPLTRFMSVWRDDGRSEFRVGVRLGADCLGCCWVLMFVAVAGGTMNLAWMGLATLVMISEKFPMLGKMVRAPLGIALIVAAIGVIAMSQQ